MIKTRYRDYAVDAFRFYGIMHKPKNIQLAVYRLKEHLLTHRINLNKAQFDACMDDLIAVIQMVDQFKKKHNGEDLLSVLSIYTDQDPTLRGAISAAVVRVSIQRHISTATVDRYLKICRDTFAEIRGLRVSA